MQPLLLHIRITYWLRSCTPYETTKMAELVDLCIMEAMHASTGIDFDQYEGAKERLRLPTRMKGGGIKRMEDIRYPAFLGALLDILPK